MLADASPSSMDIGGHTQSAVWFIFAVRTRLTYKGYPGVAGLPWGGTPAAFWMLVVDGVPVPRENRLIDVDRAIRELEATGLAFDDQLGRSLLNPADPEHVTALLERMAGRR